jgi:hypothetical protein
VGGVPPATHSRRAPSARESGRRTRAPACASPNLHLIFTGDRRIFTRLRVRLDFPA